MDEQTAVEFDALQIALNQIKSGLPLADVFGTQMTPDEIRHDLVQSLLAVLAVAV